MKFLAELMTDWRRLGPDNANLPSPSEQGTGEFDLDSDEDIADTLPNPNGEQDAPNDPELDGIQDQAEEDPDRAGLIRTVVGAHLIYKRKTEDGSFEELWIYNISSLRDEMKVRKAILAGTDIPVSKMKSEDGDQEYTLWAVGNAELLNITGLPN